MIGVRFVAFGLVLLVAGGVWLVGPWALLAGGVVFVLCGLLVPWEVTSAEPPVASP